MKKLTITICLWFFLGMSVFAQTEAIHTVKRGESFALIAKRYGITEEQLKAANPNKTVCYVGLKLELPKNTASQGTDLQVDGNDTAAQSESSFADTGKQIANVESSHPKKKKKGFWKGIGDFFSGMGDVVVAVADGLSETGLIDNTGNVGTYIGGTADIVNLTRGTQSNYLGEATNGEYSSDGGNNTDESSSTMATSSTNLQGLKNRLAWVENRIPQVDNNLTEILKQDKSNDNKKQAAQYRAIKKSSGRYYTGNSVSRNVKANAKRIEEAQKPYLEKKRQSKIMIERLETERRKLLKEKHSLTSRIEEIENGSSDTNEIEASSSNSKRSYDYYKDIYDRWERRAKSNYESLTNLGIKTKKNGTDVGGTAGGPESMSPTSYTGMQKALRTAQKEMRSTRMKASKDGYNIPQSTYETISVSY